MSWVNKCPVGLLEITIPVINFLEQLLHGSKVVCDSGFRHSQPNLLRETQVMRLGESTGQQWTMDSSAARGKDNTLAGESPISTHLRRRLLQ